MARTAGGWGALVAVALLAGCGGGPEPALTEEAIDEPIEESPRAQVQAVAGGTYTFNVNSDATVDARTPDTNLGSETRLTVDGSPERRTYLRFEVQGLAGLRVKRATLRLFATDPSSDGPAVYASAPTWVFNRITWNNAPPPRGPALADVGAVADNAFTEWDVTHWVRGTGEYSFVLVSTSDDGVVYLSDNGTGDERDPQLVLELEPCEAPRPVVLRPELDTTVSEATPDTSGRQAPLLVADGSPRQEAWLYFRVGTDRPIRNARLRLHVRDGSWDGPALYRASPSWTGGDVTWNSRPALEGAPLVDLGAVRTGSWVELDVSGAVTGPGTYGFALVPTSGDGVDFTSQEGTAGFLPELVLDVDGPSCGYQGDGIGGTVSLPTQIGGRGDELLRAMAPDGSGGYVVVGEYSARSSLDRADYGTGPLPDGQGLVLARYRADGTPVWVKAFPAQWGTWAHTVAVAPDGSIFLTGTYRRAVDLGAGPLPEVDSLETNFFIARFSSAGQTLWSRGFSPAAPDENSTGFAVPLAVAADANGGLVVMGNFAGLLDLGGGVLSSGPYTSGTLPEETGTFLARFRADGSHQWSKALPCGVTGATRGDVLGVAGDGSFVVAGQLSADSDLGDGPAGVGPALFVARFSAAGGLLWKRVLSGASGHMMGVGVSGDRVFFGGEFAGAFTFGGQTYTQVPPGGLYSVDSDVFVGALSLSGGDVWLRHVGSSSPDSLFSLAVQPGGQVVMVGALNRPAEVGPITLDTVGNFAGAFSPEGDVRWVRSFGAAPVNEVAVLSTGEVLTSLHLHVNGPATVDGIEYLPVGGSSDFLLLKLRP